MSTYIINPKDQNISIQTIIDRIHNGYKIQESLENELEDAEKVEFNNAIIIAPDYQREYRSNSEDESSLIESVLLGIPIPPVFMANDKLKGVQVLNVVDGQHRLRAFYRFVANNFKLTKVSILTDLEGLHFNELDIETRIKILSKELSATVFKDFPGKKFELEIFNRYNKGTKPLSQQEIRNAVFNSKINEMVNDFSKKLFLDKNNSLKIAYNITKDRLQKKKLQESIFVILSILEKGINVKIQRSPQYAEEFMKEKSELEQDDIKSFKENYILIRDLFDEFNKFIIRIGTKIEYPFSKELYGINNRNYKFQISLAMFLAGVFKKLKNTDENILSSISSDEEFLYEFLLKVSKHLNNSFLEDPNYSASSTNPAELEKLVSTFEFRKTS